MVKSMTGYGRARETRNKRDITVEVRSVNNRYLDCTVKLPRAYVFAEDAIKGRVQKAVSRGKVDVFVTIDSSAADVSVVKVNEPLDVDAVIVPVGGGGLISGVACAIKSRKPDVKVYGVQAEGAPSMYRSLHEHKYQTLSAVSTFADGIQVKTPGELTYKLCEEYVDDIVTVTEDETAAAILSLMENQKLVAEGAGAVPVAAALFHKLPIEGEKVVCLVSGGNIDVNILNRVITRGLVMSGRKANLTIALEDKPGQLQQVADIVSRCGSNVVSVLHDGSDPNMPISSCFLKLTLETRDNAQIEQIRQELTKAGFQLVAERV